MHNVLHVLELFLDAQQLVSLEWVLPVSKEDLHLGKLQGMVRIEGLIKDARGLELVSKLHDELVEAGVGGTLIILVVSNHLLRQCSHCAVDFTSMNPNRNAQFRCRPTHHHCE